MLVHSIGLAEADTDMRIVFFQGKYVDQNHDNETMGFAYLAN